MRAGGNAGLSLFAAKKGSPIYQDTRVIDGGFHLAGKCSRGVYAL
jgi:hypothetical protein